MIENAAVSFLQPSLIKSIINHTGAILDNNNNNKNNIRTQTSNLVRTTRFCDKIH